MRHEIFIMCDADRVRVARAAQVVALGTLVSWRIVSDKRPKTPAQIRNGGTRPELRAE